MTDKVLKNNFYVFTGGPGAGKSTLLDVLRNKGFRCVPETGRQIIRARLEKGLSPRPAPSEFARGMFESDFGNFMANVASRHIVFFDRSFLDSAVLISQSDPKYFGEIGPLLETHRFNHKVFVAPPWEEIFHNDDERDQSFTEAEQVYRTMSDWYTLNGYRVVELPRVSIDERVAFVLEHVEYV